MEHRYTPSLRLLSAGLLCVVFHGLRGQTLTATDVLLTEGHTYRMQAITDMLPWDTLSGSNVTWDYDWITVDSTDNQTYQWLDPANGQGAANYPEANYAERSVSGANNDYIIDEYYTLGANELLSIGSVGPVLSYVYETPEIAFSFPSAVGDTSGGSYCFTSDGFGIQYHFCGTDYVTYDASGTLVLPYGTFPQAMHVTQWRSSLETTGGGADSSYAIRQAWFIAGVPHPVLDVNVFIDETGQWWPAGRLMAQSSATALPELTDRTNWTVRPNPTTGLITLFDLPARTRRVELLATDGRQLRDLATNVLSSSPSFDLSDLNAGTYLVRVIAAEGATVKRVVVSAR